MLEKQNNIWIGINSHMHFNTTFYADDQIIVKESDGDFQMSVYFLLRLLLNIIIMQIFTVKTKVMAFSGKSLSDPVFPFLTC